MNEATLMALENINPETLGGNGKRKCESWIETFVERTVLTDSPEPFRRWTAIFTLAAAMEMKCWLKTASSPIYPNLYVFIIGQPGVGKNRIMRVGKKLLRTIPDYHVAPISMTSASMVDALATAKRQWTVPGQPSLEYNSMAIMAEELTAFMHQYDQEVIGNLSAFYDPDPYEQTRRTNGIKIKIDSPQINLISGTTPSNLLSFMPDTAWDQGFTSRIILVYSTEKIIGDDFAETASMHSDDLEHDLYLISQLTGEFRVTQEYQNAVNNWRALGEPPAMPHPKLVHYKTRRRVHLYKLSMVSAVDRGDVFLLTKDDFNRAMGWLLEAERTMADIFAVGSASSDAKALDEIIHYISVMDKGEGVAEHMIINFARAKIPIHSIMNVINIMVASGQIRVQRYDKLRTRHFCLNGGKSAITP